MEPGQIVLQTQTKKGRLITVRYPLPSDLQAMTDYINTLSLERSFIFFQGEQNTLEEEKEFLDSIFKKMSKKTGVHLHVFHNDQLIGSAGVTMKEKATKHVGEFGISVAKAYRGEGIGRLLMKATLDEAEKNLPDLKICVLGVFSDNSLAKNMYQSFGFKEYGKLPQGIKHKDHYDDEYFMYKEM